VTKFAAGYSPNNPAVPCSSYVESHLVYRFAWDANFFSSDCGGKLACSQGGSQSIHSDPFQSEIQVKVLFAPMHD
jgi:hypothetical protein